MKYTNECFYNLSRALRGCIDYDLECYATLIGSDRYGNEGAVPFVIKA